MPIGSVKVTINGTTTTLTDNGDGTYSGTLAAPNKTSYNVNGGHYYPVTVVATNSAGTSTTVDDTHATLGASCRLYVVEKTAPTITINSPTSGAYLATSTPTINFDVIDESNGSGIAISTLTFTLDGTTYTNVHPDVLVDQITNGYNVAFIPVSAIADGEHTLTINVKDNDGNSATSATIKFTTDTVAPTLSITNPSESDSYTSDANLVVKGTATDSTSGTPRILVTVNGTKYYEEYAENDGSFEASVTLTHGLNTIIVTATDLAGKVTTITRTITLDTSTPVIASVAINPNPVNVGASYQVTIKVS